jgi:hypothetical protein
MFIVPVAPGLIGRNAIRAEPPALDFRTEFELNATMILSGRQGIGSNAIELGRKPGIKLLFDRKVKASKIRVRSIAIHRSRSQSIAGSTIM